MERSDVRIGLLHSRVRIEERRLRDALAALGVAVTLVHEDEVAFDLRGRGFRDFDLIVESCEDYTIAQTALRTLEHLGVRTINRPATVDLCGNKALMTMRLIAAGLPVPRAEIALSTEAALAAIDKLGYPVVTKPLVGGDTHLLALIEDREAAEALRGWLVQVPEHEAWKLPKGQYYWHQIIGLDVVTKDGRRLGSVADILETGANDVYIVKRDGGELLLPAIKDVIKKISPETGEMIVELLPGME